MLSLHVVYQGHDQEDEGSDEHESLSRDVSQEVVMVPEADTIVDPWAVMVEPFYTFVADTAVTRSVSSHRFTVRAQKDRIKHLHQLKEWNSFG